MTRSARTPVGKKLVSPDTKGPADVPKSAQLRPQKDKYPTASLNRSLKEPRRPNPSISSPTDHSGRRPTTQARPSSDSFGKTSRAGRRRCSQPRRQRRYSNPYWDRGSLS